MALSLSMICGPYDRIQPLANGAVQPEGIKLTVTVDPDDRRRQPRARSGEFDIVESYTGEYVIDLKHRKLGYTAIPIFVKRIMRHSYIYVNRRAGITRPTDLNGKRVSLQQWATTAALWGRGILEDEYGVDIKSIQWVAHYPVAEANWTPPSWLKLERAPGGISPHDYLASGGVDAGITTECFAPFDPDIDFLFPNYVEEEKAYYKKTGFFPIHHTLLIRTSILEEHPWVAMSVFNAWMEAKQKTYEWLEWQRVHQTGLFYRALWEEERALAGPDPYVWGFKKSRAELEALLGYCRRYGVTDMDITPEQLFHPSTLDT